MTEIKYKSDVLKDFIPKLKASGFKVYRYADKENRPISWVIIEKNNKLGSIQVKDLFNGITFSTKHKPCREAGTGYSLGEEGTINPTIDQAEETFILYPNWAKAKDRQHIKKYESFDEYQKDEHVLKYIEII